MFGFAKTDIKRFIVLTILLVWCATMIAVRVERTGSWYYRFLLGNLFLAFIPLLLSTGLRLADYLKLPSIILLLISCLWLLFLPNAPYILTDLIHLTNANHAPLWYDLALLLSCAGTGLLMGYLSLVDVQAIVARRFSVMVSWLFAIVTLGLSGFAIYLGRFLRWNSWDVITTPTLLFDLFSVATRPHDQVRPIAVTVIFGGILILGYISLHLSFVTAEAQRK